jgi:hypothetical protein
VIHRRAILFVKPPPSYWIIIDSLEGRGEHSLDLLFHLTPEVHVCHSSEGGIIISQTQGRSTEIRSLMPEPDAPAVISGQLEPRIQGWLSRTTGTREPATVLSFRKRGKLPQAFATLIRPQDSTYLSFDIRAPDVSECFESLRFAWNLCWPGTLDKVSILSAVEVSSASGRMKALVERSSDGQPVWSEDTDSVCKAEECLSHEEV